MDDSDDKVKIGFMYGSIAYLLNYVAVMIFVTFEKYFAEDGGVANNIGRFTGASNPDITGAQAHEVMGVVYVQYA